MRSGGWFTDECSWSEAEKKTARRAFEWAYQRRCEPIAAEIKKMVASSYAPSEVWQIHDYLSEQRKTVDKTFDFRYSVLLSVFAHLLRNDWLKEAELAGLQEDKIEKIKRWATL